MQPTPEEVNDKSGLACVRVSSLLRCRVWIQPKSEEVNNNSGHVCVRVSSLLRCRIWIQPNYEEVNDKSRYACVCFFPVRINCCQGTRATLLLNKDMSARVLCFGVEVQGLDATKT